MNRILILFILCLFLLSCSSEPTPQNMENSNFNQPSTPLRIVFLGNSITAGYGLSNPLKAFPNLIQEKFNEANIPAKVINAGISGETTGGGLERLPLILSYPIDILVIELGINDYLQGLSKESTMFNLGKMISLIQEKQPKTTILLTDILLSTLDPTPLAKDFQAMFEAVAEENEVILLPSYLEYIWTDSTLVLADRLHPNTEGYEEIASRVWHSLNKLTQLK